MLDILVPKIHYFYVNKIKLIWKTFLSLNLHREIKMHTKNQMSSFSLCLSIKFSNLNHDYIFFPPFIIPLLTKIFHLKLENVI